MTFTSVSNIAEKSRKPRGNNVNRDGASQSLLFSSNSKGVGDEQRQISFRISAPLAREARLLIGDRVDILFDTKDRIGLIKRVKSGGYKLTTNGMPRSDIKEGAYYACSVKMTHYAGMPMIGKSTDCESVNVKDEGIMFVFPAAAKF